MGIGLLLPSNHTNLTATARGPQNIMKSKIQVVFVAFVLMQVAHFQCSIAQAQGTTFTYQGRLSANGAPANGVYDLNFGLFSTSSGGSLIGNSDSVVGVSVTNGLFTVQLDFGANFPGASRWLEIAVRTNGGAVFTTVVPRQQLTATPYAITAGSLVSGGLPAVYTNVVTFNNTNNNFTGSFAGNGSGLTNVNAATLGGLGAASFWNTAGNSNTTGINFLGTVDNQALELRVNGERALRLEPNGGSPNVVGGSSSNFVTAGVAGATIAGGGFGFGYANSIKANFSAIAGGRGNTIAAGEAVIAGGLFNSIQSVADDSFIGGGQQNTIEFLATYSTIGGGDFNVVHYNASVSTIAGGQQNAIQTNASFCFIGGGDGNTIEKGVETSTIGGGAANVIKANSNGATIPGGYNNLATNASFAAGSNAKADDPGSFVWADSSTPDFHSTTANQFRVRATGGAAFVTAIDVNGNVTAGVHVLSGDTAWSSISDRNAKKNFQPVDSQAILEKLAAVPVQSWNYKWESDANTPHLGPMAQDFKAAFYPGRDDKSISTLEFDGVELAAIQGLNQKIEEQKMDLNTRDARISALEKEILELKEAVKKLSNTKE
jgi:hypothetical protein